MLHRLIQFFRKWLSDNKPDPIRQAEIDKLEERGGIW